VAKQVQIDVLCVADCPNHAATVQRVREVVERRGWRASIREIEVRDDAEAKALRFLGSPSVRINGMDIDPAARTRQDFGLTCRMYSGAGVPPVPMIEAALDETATGTDAPQRPAGDAPAPENSSKGVLLIAGAAGGAILSSACCWVPLLLMATGASAAGLAGAFDRWRWPLAGLACALLGVGFYRAYRRPAVADCCAPAAGRRRFERGLVWLAALLVAGGILFPYYGAALLAAQQQAPPAQPQGPVIAELVIPIRGMTCDGCARLLTARLSTVPAVATVNVSYPQDRARVQVTADDPALRRSLVETIRRAGYEADADHIQKNASSGD